MLGMMRRGSRVDRPKSLIQIFGSMIRMTPKDSPRTMDDVLHSPLYGDLSRPKLAVGDRAFAFDLPTGHGEERVRLADFAGVRPVALIFGSYT